MALMGRLCTGALAVKRGRAKVPLSQSWRAHLHGSPAHDHSLSAAAVGVPRDASAQPRSGGHTASSAGLLGPKPEVTCEATVSGTEEALGVDKFSVCCC